MFQKWKYRKLKRKILKHGKVVVGKVIRIDEMTPDYVINSLCEGKKILHSVLIVYRTAEGDDICLSLKTSKLDEYHSIGQEVPLRYIYENSRAIAIPETFLKEKNLDYTDED